MTRPFNRLKTIQKNFLPAKFENTVLVLIWWTVFICSSYFNLTLSNWDFEKLIWELLICILSAKDIALIIGQRRRMTISSWRHISFLLTLEPPDTLEIASTNFKFLWVDNLSLFVCFYLTLELIYLLIQSYQYICIIKALLLVIDSSVYKHFVSLRDHKSYVTFPRWRLVSRVGNGLQLGPDLSCHIVLVKVIETCAFATPSEYQ